MTVLFFLHPGTNSRSQFTDLIKGFGQAGHTVIIWDTTQAAQLITAQPQNQAAIREQVSTQLGKLIRDRKIDMSVAMWGNGLGLTSNHQIDGRVVTFFERLACPHLLMWLDAPERAHQESVRPVFKSGFFGLPYLFHFINNPVTAIEMREVYRFKNVLPRHYGVNPDAFKPYPDEPKQFDLVFNANFGCWDDAPDWVSGELGKDEPDILALRTAVAQSQRNERLKLVERFAPALGDAADLMLERLAEMQLQNRERPMLGRVRELTAAGSAAAKATLEDPELYAAVATQIRRIESYERAFVFVHLSKHFNCGLFGNIDYSRMGCSVKSLGLVKYEDQARIYNQAKIGLSVMRWEDEAGYHVKPYEITASGVACMAQHRQETDHLFTDSELIRFHTPADARRKVRELLDDPAKLTALAAGGRARTLRDHTWATWANDMIGQIAQWKSQHSPSHAAA
jgi:spore maturation protein CgeB